MLCVLASPQLSQAQNKVVVIPLSGDDAELEPTAPVAKVDPDQTDYTMGTLTVIDNITGLEWQRSDDNVERILDDALDYCTDLTLDGKTDWRLPDIIELQSIVDYGQTQAPFIDRIAFPDTGDRYWSSTREANNSMDAFFVTFGFISQGISPVSNTLINISYTVRCVR